VSHGKEGTLLAEAAFRCYNACQRMADWKQITARIRRARTSKDPAGQLSNLYQKTRDAMVAFELAKYFETSGQNAEAAKWYFSAAERFRRADWKTKAQEAAVRLGGVPGELPLETAITQSDDFMLTSPPVTAPEPDLPFEQHAEALESAVALTSEVQQATESSPDGPAPTELERKRHRRGRRGGRNRRKGGIAKEPASTPAQRTAEAPATRRGLPPAVFSEPAAEPTPSRVTHSRPIPSLPIESIAEPGGPSVKGRYGDPGLSSRLSLLEMQFRRLLTCPPVSLNEADTAPVGPGVFVLTDSDLTSYYYVEACQTLRIAIGNLLRGGSSRRGVDSIKPQLAEHLGIPETRVAKYLADHCVVRWLQLDEGASHFAHFVVAVLRPSLNE
jgi:hypothetical protein